MKYLPPLLAALLLTACTDSAQNNKPNAEQSEPASQTSEPASQTTSQSSPSPPLLSNIADPASRDKASSALSEHLAADDVARVLGWIDDYNATIARTSLLSGFVATSEPEYDVSTIDKLWQDAKGEFVGTNCRINSFGLLQNTIGFDDKVLTSTDLLFIDHEAIRTGKLFDDSELDKFNRLFAKVATEPTTDVQVHAAKMRAHFDGIRFSDTATMLSVVIHDDLERERGGDFLFIGHVGVLVPSSDGYLFIEKISFQEPYQAIEFNSKDEAYTYLLDKYAIDYDQPTALPFVMENDRLVKWRAQS